jgi:hypothetical protein
MLRLLLLLAYQVVVLLPKHSAVTTAMLLMEVYKVMLRAPVPLCPRIGLRWKGGSKQGY